MAGECGYRSMLVAIGLAQELEPSCEVINYEAPFGVGYMVVGLIDEASRQPSKIMILGGSDSPAIV